MANDVTRIEELLLQLAAEAGERDDPLTEGMTLATLRLRVWPIRVQRHFVNLVTESIRLIEEIRDGCHAART